MGINRDEQIDQPGLVMGVLRGLLRRYSDFKQRYKDKHEPQYVEKISEIGWLSWMSLRDSTVGCRDGGAHEFCVERVIDPLTNTDKHDAGEDKKCMDIGDAFELYSQDGNYPRCTKCNKELVPVLNLKPGMNFIPHAGPRPLVASQTSTQAGPRTGSL